SAPTIETVILSDTACGAAAKSAKTSDSAVSRLTLPVYAFAGTSRRPSGLPAAGEAGLMACAMDENGIGEHLARAPRGLRASLHDDDAVDEDEGNPVRVRVRRLIRGRVTDAVGIEDNQIGRVADADQAAFVEVKMLRRQRRHLADGALEGQDAPGADVR